MKKISPFLIVLFAVIPTGLFSSHIVGSWLEYEYLGNNRYDVEIFMLRDPAALPILPPIELFVFNLSTNSDTTFMFPRVEVRDTLIHTAIDCNGILGPGIHYEIHRFRDTIMLLPDSIGYRMVTIQNSRAPLTNVPSQPQFMEYHIYPIDTGWVNSSPKWDGFYGGFGCENHTMMVNLSATDNDGDSLVYYLETASCEEDPLHLSPPCHYVGGYSGTNPFTATSLNLDGETGLFTATPAKLIPIAVRKYLIKVGLDEYRSGELLGSYEKEFVITIAPCDPLTKATIGLNGHNDSIAVCMGYTYQFPNNSIGADSFYWDFDYPNGVDTSTQPSPTFTYPDTGIYQVMLVAYGDSCVDSSFSIVSVYPYLTVDFAAPDSVCAQTSVQFTNQSTSTYDPIIKYRWEFGDGDSSNQASPSKDFIWPGDYTNKLQVVTAMGCTSEISKTMRVDSLPSVDLEPEVIICQGDTAFPLVVTSGESFSWIPGGAVVCDTCPNTGLFPTQTTDYILTAYNDRGCYKSDTITVVVLPETLLTGNIQTSQGQPYQNGKVLLIEYNPLDSTVTAIDSGWTNGQGNFAFFTGQPQVYIKATADSAAYPNELPTYYESGLVWDSADVVSSQPCDSIFLSFSTIGGTNPGGQGFIAGNVFQGAGKMMDRSDPIEGLTLILMDEAGNPVALTTTDHEGYYQFSNLSLGRYAIWADKPFMKNNAAPEVELTSIDPTVDSLWIKYYDRQLFLDVTSLPPMEAIAGWKIYPNPASTVLYLERSGQIDGEIKISMVNALGQRVLQKEMAGPLAQLDISKMEVGLYFIQLQHPGGMHVYPIIVNR